MDYGYAALRPIDGLLRTLGSHHVLNRGHTPQSFILHSRLSSVSCYPNYLSNLDLESHELINQSAGSMVLTVMKDVSPSPM